MTGRPCYGVVLGYVSADEAIEDLNTRYNAALESGLSNGTCKRVIVENYDPLQPSAGTVTYKQSKTLSGYGCRKEKDACIHMDPLPWKVAPWKDRSIWMQAA